MCVVFIVGLLLQRYRHLLNMDEDGHAEFDVDKVDMKKKPGMAQIPWYQAVLKAGDCMYIPYR